MTAELRWEGVLAELEEAGWQARVVSASRAGDLEAAVNQAVDDAAVPAAFKESVSRYLRVSFPEDMPQPRSMLIGAAARPYTQASLLWKGKRRAIGIPPHYRGYELATPEFTAAAEAPLRAWGFSAAPFSPPLKTLATHSGLARYGRNNLAYVPGLGSFLTLAACVSDAPPPAQDFWQQPAVLDRCSSCRTCSRVCPTGAVPGERFLIRAERCLTFFNEDDAPFPDWIRPEWHAYAVGCLRCQDVCPENRATPMVIEPAVEFDAGESQAIIAGVDPASFTAETRKKLAACGLDYSSSFVPRNIRQLLWAQAGARPPVPS